MNLFKEPRKLSTSSVVDRAGIEPACDELIFVTSLDTTPNTLQHCRFTYILASTNSATCPIFYKKQVEDRRARTFIETSFLLTVGEYVSSC